MRDKIHDHRESNLQVRQSWWSQKRFLGIGAKNDRKLRVYVHSGLIVHLSFLCYGSYYAIFSKCISTSLGFGLLISLVFHFQKTGLRSYCLQPIWSWFVSKSAARRSESLVDTAELPDTIKTSDYYKLQSEAEKEKFQELFELAMKQPGRQASFLVLKKVGVSGCFDYRNYLKTAKFIRPNYIRNCWAKANK